MENLANDVVETTTDVVTESCFSASKVLIVAVPVVAIVGLGFLVRKLWNKRKQKKAVEATETKEVNPEV